MRHLLRLMTNTFIIAVLMRGTGAALLLLADEDVAR